MIVQYQFLMKASLDHPLYADSAYRLYAYLLEQLSPCDAALIHENDTRGITQYLRYVKSDKIYIWTINILLDPIAHILCPILDKLTQVCIENQVFLISDRMKLVRNVNDFLSHCIQENRCTLIFSSPTAFKQQGRYTIFPQERLILQSLVNCWNEVFPMCALEDQDAFNAMLAGIHIVDYQLRTSRFFLKGARIPGFSGNCIIEAKLAPPLLALWNSLLLFSEFSGIGIKTGIGMGGVHTSHRNAVVRLSSQM